MRWRAARPSRPSSESLCSRSVRRRDCSADGQRVLFHREENGSPVLLELSIGTRDERRLETALASGEGARYAPDGERIAFVSDANPERQPDLYVADLAGGERRRVTRDRHRESWPRWTSDGEALVYSADRGSDDVWLVDVGPFLDRYFPD